MARKQVNDGCLALVAKLLGVSPKERDSKPLPYGKRDHFLSAAEISFYHVLRNTLGDDLQLLCKVRMGDLFYVKRPNENRPARNRIDRKHIDFVICQSDTMEPLLGIELDDKSHQRPDRAKRDSFVDAVFKVAGLPILHIKAARGYKPEELAEKVMTALSAQDPDPSANQQES